MHAAGVDSSSISSRSRKWLQPVVVLSSSRTSTVTANGHHSGILREIPNNQKRPSLPLSTLPAHGNKRIKHLNVQNSRNNCRNAASSAKGATTVSAAAKTRSLRSTTQLKHTPVAESAAVGCCDFPSPPLPMDTLQNKRTQIATAPSTQQTCIAEGQDNATNYQNKIISLNTDLDTVSMEMTSCAAEIISRIQTGKINQKGARINTGSTQTRELNGNGDHIDGSSSCESNSALNTNISSGYSSGSAPTISTALGGLKLISPVGPSCLPNQHSSNNLNKDRAEILCLENSTFEPLMCSTPIVTQSMPRFSTLVDQQPLHQHQYHDHHDSEVIATKSCQKQAEEHVRADLSMKEAGEKTKHRKKKQRIRLKDKRPTHNVNNQSKHNGRMRSITQSLQKWTKLKNNNSLPLAAKKRNHEKTSSTPIKQLPSYVIDRLDLHHKTSSWLSRREENPSSLLCPLVTTENSVHDEQDEDHKVIDCCSFNDVTCMNIQLDPILNL